MRGKRWKRWVGDEGSGRKRIGMQMGRSRRRERRRWMRKIEGRR